MSRIRHNNESGQGAVELALCLPVFVILILASVEVANLAWSSVQLSNAAHAAVQYGSQSHANASTSAANILKIEQAAINEVPASFSITFPTAPSQACACVSTSGTSTSADCSTISTKTGSCPSPNVITDTLQVTVQGIVKPIIHYPGLPATYTLKTTATTPVINK